MWLFMTTWMTCVRVVLEGLFSLGIGAEALVIIVETLEGTALL